MALFTYDPKLVKLVIGARTIDSLQEGSSITLEPSASVSSTQNGVDRDFTRNVNTNIHYLLTFTVQNGSPNNTYLDSVINGSMVLPVYLVDKNTENTRASGLTYIQDIPPMVYETASQGVEYVFACVDVTRNLGGVA